MIGVLWRIANAGGAHRARIIETSRRERNGGSRRELEQRIDKLVSRLEKVARELEDTLA
jgi:hypothetical protein